MLALFIGGMDMENDKYKKSSLDAVTVAAQTFTDDAGGVIEFNQNNVLTGSSIFHFNGTNVRLLKAGLYLVSVDADVLATAAGDVTLQLLNNGVAVPGAQATITAAAADTEHVSFTALVTVPLTCCGYNATTENLTVSISAASTVTNAHIVVAKLA